MDVNAVLPFVSAFIMVFFVFFVFRRFVVKGGKAYHLLLWGIGLLFYLLGGLAESIHSVFGWNPLVFRLWYLCGAVLVAAWLGQGTVQLLVRRRIFGVRLSLVLLVILTLGSAYAAVKVLTAQLEPVMIADRVEVVTAEPGYDEETVLSAAASALAGTALDDEGRVSERRLSPLAQTVLAAADREGLKPDIPSELSVTTLPNIQADVGGQTVTLRPDGTQLRVVINGQPAGAIALGIDREMHGHAIVSSGTRVLTPFFNTYGLVTLVGGAIYSAYIFLRKRIMPNRVIGNVLIASGALMPGIGGLLSRFGLGGYLYLGEFLGAVLMFAGFIVATNRPEPTTVRQAAEPV